MPVAGWKLKKVTARISQYLFTTLKERENNSKMQRKKKKKISKQTSWVFESIFLLLGSCSTCWYVCKTCTTKKKLKKVQTCKNVKLIINVKDNECRLKING